MRNDLQFYLASRPDLRQFIRENPVWYRLLSRNPHDIQELERQAKVYYGKTFPQKINRLQNNLNLSLMLLQMIQGMGAGE